MRPGMMVRLLARLEAFAYRQAERVVPVTDSFVEHIAARCGAANKITVIKNGVDPGLFKPDARAAAELKSALGLEGRFVAAYAGTHGMAHGLETILDAAERLKGDERIVFLMVGDGAERGRLQQLAASRGLGNIRFLGQRPKAEMPAIWGVTDVSLILLRRHDLFKKVIPSKMFEAMAMQCPIILGVEGEALELLDNARAGIAITPESAGELAAAVERLGGDAGLAASLGAQGAAYVHEHFDRTMLATRYLRLLEDVCAEAQRERAVQIRRNRRLVPE